MVDGKNFEIFIVGNVNSGLTMMQYPIIVVMQKVMMVVQILILLNAKSPSGSFTKCVEGMSSTCESSARLADQYQRLKSDVLHHRWRG